jgi:hypothetical protein
MEPCDYNMFVNYNSGYYSPNLYTEEEINRIKSFSLCLPNKINLNLKSKSNRKDTIQLAFPFESYANLIKKYDIIGIMINYKQIVLNPNNSTNYYSELWRQEIYYPDTIYQKFYKLDLENYNLLKDDTIFLFLMNKKNKL